MRVSEYRKLLASQDWFYQNSDDHTVWSSGRYTFETLRRQQGILDPDAEIWNELAPAEFKIYTK